MLNSPVKNLWTALRHEVEARLVDRLGEPLTWGPHTWGRAWRWVQGLPPVPAEDATAAHLPRTMAAAPRLPERPLPPGLAARLRQIPRQEVLCRDFEAGWAQLARGELPAARAAALESHLAACPRCAATFEVLAAVVRAPLLPLPGALNFRIARLGRAAEGGGPRLLPERLQPALAALRRRLPFPGWLLGSPATMAVASLVLTLVLVGGLEPLLPEGLPGSLYPLEAPLEAAFDEAAQRGESLYESFRDQTRRGLSEPRSKALQYQETLHEGIERFRQTVWRPEESGPSQEPPPEASDDPRS